MSIEFEIRWLLAFLEREGSLRAATTGGQRSDPADSLRAEPADGFACQACRVLKLS